MKTAPSAPRTTAWRPLNMAANRLGLGALRSVLTVVVKRQPPTLSTTWSLSANTACRAGELRAVAYGHI
jgi:hypothetical protein